MTHTRRDDPINIGARANEAKASTTRAKGKGSKDRTGTTARTRTRIRLNVGIVESVDTRKTVGSRKTPTKVVEGKTQTKDSADAHHLDSEPLKMLSQKSNSVDSTCFTSMFTVLKCEGLSASRLEWTQVLEDGVASECHVREDDSW